MNNNPTIMLSRILRFLDNIILYVSIFNLPFKSGLLSHVS